MYSEITQGNFLANVKSTGAVATATAGKTITGCLMDMTYFPFDQHKCIIKFSNWIYTSKQLKLVNASYELDLTLFNENSQWTLKQNYMTMEVDILDGDVYEMVIVKLRELYS